MKKIAIALAVLAVLFAGALGYGLFNTNVKVLAKGLQTIPAAQRAQEFSSLRQALENGSLLGTPLRATTLGDAEDYTFYLYTLRLHNPGLVPAEMVELQLAPASADILYYGETEEIILQPGETGDVWCMLLTQGTPHAVRDFYITYYLWGHAHEVKFTYDNTI